MLPLAFPPLLCGCRLPPEPFPPELSRPARPDAMASVAFPEMLVKRLLSPSEEHAERAATPTRAAQVLPDEPSFSESCIAHPKPPQGNASWSRKLRGCRNALRRTRHRRRLLQILDEIMDETQLFTDFLGDCERIGIRKAHTSVQRIERNRKPHPLPHQ